MPHRIDSAAEKLADRHGEIFTDLAREYAARHAKFKRSGPEDLRILKTGKRPAEPFVKRWAR